MTVKDETYVFIQDVKDKKITARSARHTRTHCGKGGKVRFPSDNLSKKELQKMNGECKSYRLNDPMTWNEFMSMPDDIKVTYVKLLREKFSCPDAKIGEMMGADKDKVSRTFKKLGLRQGHVKREKPFDREGFYAWVNRVDKLPAPTTEEEPVQEEKEAAIIEEPVNVAKGMSYIANPEAFVEDDLPFEEPDLVPVEKYRMLDAEICSLNHQNDELMKVNEELVAVHEKDKQKIAWLENRVNDLELERHILEKQMEVVRMIFGGKTHG